MNTHPFDLKFVSFCPKFSGDSCLAFREKTILGEFFRNFVQTKAILYRNLWNFALRSAILFWFRIALKIFTQVLTYVVCTQVRRQVHRQITKRRSGQEKPGRFVFGKSVSFTLGPGLTTPYSMGILVWNFYRTLFIVSTEFWLRLEPQIRFTRFAINFLFITATVVMKVRLCVKLFDFFPRWILIRLTWNLSRFVPNSVKILRWNFWKKTISGVLSEILCKPRLSSTETCEILPYFLQFYSGSILCWKNSHKYFRMFFVPR